MFEPFLRFWCRKLHPRPMWPMHGKYICPRCFREYRLDWDVRKHQLASVVAAAPGRRPVAGRTVSGVEIGIKSIELSGGEPR